MLNSLTSKPVSHALVEIVGTAYHATLTDADGRFSLEDLPAGSVRLEAQKPGFVGTGSYKTLDRTQITVEVGPQNNHATLRLAPESVINGRLIDEDKAPIEGAVVSLLRADILEGRKRWQRLPMSSISDTGGNFRFAELGAASYCIVVSTRNVAVYDAAERYPDLYYYPGNPMASSAETQLDLRAGQQEQLDLSLSRMPAYQVSGTVFATTAFRQLSVHVLDPGGDVLSFPVHFETNGKFQIEKIPSGSYLLRSEIQSVNGHIFFSTQDIDIDSSVGDLMVPLTPPVSIPVYVRLGVSDTAPVCDVQSAIKGIDCVQSLESAVTLVLYSKKGWEGDVHSVFESHPDPLLKVADVDPGEYSVSVRSSRGFVSSVRCGGVDLLRETLIVQPGGTVTPIEVVLRDDSASVSGTIRSDKPIRRASVLLASEAAPLQAPVVVNANLLGGFSLQGLAPGDYTIFAFDNIKDLEYANPEALNRFSSQAERVTLSPNANKDLVVNLIVTDDE